MRLDGYDLGSSGGHRKRLELYRRQQVFRGSTSKELLFFPTEGCLQVLSMFTSQGQTSEQLYTIPINHRQINFNMAEEVITKHLYKRDNVVEHQPSCSSFDGGMTRFDAGGNTIAIVPFEEVQRLDSDIDSEDRVDLLTNYSVELDSSAGSLPLKLKNKVARDLTAFGFEGLLSVFGMMRHQDNVGHPIKITELIEFFHIIRDIDLNDKAGIETFCWIAGLQLSPKEDLSHRNLHFVRNKIGKVIRQLTSVRFGVLEGGHRMGVVSMVSKGVFHPNHCGSEQLLASSIASQVPTIKFNSPLNVKTRFDVYMTSPKRTFKEAVKQLQTESLDKAKHQAGVMSIHEKDEMALFVQQVFCECVLPDIGDNYFTDKDQYVKHLELLVETIRRLFKDSKLKFLEISKYLRHESIRSKASDMTLTQKLDTLMDTIKGSKKTAYYGVVSAALMRIGFSREILTFMQMQVNCIIRPTQRRHLRRYLSMAIPTKTPQRHHAHQRGGVLSQSDRTRYRNLSYMHSFFVDRMRKLWPAFYQVLRAQYLRHGIVPPPKESQKNKMTTFLDRRKGLHENWFRCLLQELFLEVFNKYGEDMSIEDPVLNFILR